MRLPRFPEQHLDRMVARLRLGAQTGRYDGTTRTAPYLMSQRAMLVRPDTSVVVIYTLDEGMHACGWWKNPDYERCKHMSVSFVSTETGEPAPHDRAATAMLCRRFMDDAARLSWWEPPYSEDGKRRDVWHVRVFYAPGWSEPILPRGEVYTREFTEGGWKSWSDIHGDDERMRDSIIAGPGEQ